MITIYNDENMSVAERNREVEREREREKKESNEKHVLKMMMRMNRIIKREKE